MNLHLPRAQSPSRFRFFMGMAQMFGAVFSLALIFRLGVTALSLSSVIATGLLTGVSMVLFRPEHRPQFR